MRVALFGLIAILTLSLVITLLARTGPTRAVLAGPIATATATRTTPLTPSQTPTSTPPASPSCPAASVSDGVFSHVFSAPLPIPDNDPITGVSDCFTVSQAGTIGDLDVALDISHTWVGDLVVTLTHDDSGRSITLVDRPGVPALPSGCGGDDINATLDDEASSPVGGECGAGTPTIDGSFRPHEALDAFDGEDLTGTWTIQVTDNSPRDTGTLNGWSLIVSLPPNLPLLVGDANCDGNVNSIDATIILQFDARLLGDVWPCRFVELILASQDAADVNGDSRINSLDALLILQLDAGLIAQL